MTVCTKQLTGYDKAPHTSWIKKFGSPKFITISCSVFCQECTLVHVPCCQALFLSLKTWVALHTESFTLSSTSWLVATTAHRLGHGCLVMQSFSWHQEFEVNNFKPIDNILKVLVLLIVDYWFHFELLCNPVACETTSTYIHMWLQWTFHASLYREDLASTERQHSM